MNESGGPVRGLLDYHHLPVEDLVVIHDELDLPFATVRLKRGGGEGGHNGLRSVTRSTGTSDYLRVRVGIGRPPGRQDPADFVLKDFSATERKELDLLVVEAADAAESLLASGLEAAQNEVHPRSLRAHPSALTPATGERSPDPVDGSFTQCEGDAVSGRPVAVNSLVGRATE